MALRLPNPYKQFSKLIEQQTFEPTISWGLRMAIAATAPMIWGVATDHVEEASWISLTAEAICWMELKGSFGQSMRALVSGAILAVLFTGLGSITGTDVWWSVVCMLGVSFLAGLFKNLGDRGSGLSTTVYVLFIIANAYPTHNLHELRQRIALVCIGGAWNTIVGTAITLFMPARQPYRRMVALVWRSIAELTETIAKGWDGNSARSNIREIYLKEKAIRAAMDTSFHFYETMAHQVTQKNKHEYQLAQVRKATALIAANIIAISEELERINIKEVDDSLQLKLYAVLKAIQQTADRMAVYIIILKPEEELLLSSRISRLNKLLVLLREYELPSNEKGTAIKRVIQLCERNVRMVETCVTRLEEMGDDLPVFRSYSLLKTIAVLHPKHLWRNIRILFDLNTFTARYAVRAALASTLALFISKWFHINHGYWLPFTVVLVLQPFFGATLKKAFDRIVGTILGGVAGGLLLRSHAPLFVNEIFLFFCFILMVYYLRKQYAIAAFFITFSVAILFDFETALNTSLLLTRALSTAGGAALAIVAGFALLPHWDKKWLPIHLADAVMANYEYFTATFFPGSPLVNWTRFKRTAETKNSNAFDSFNRYMQEPSFSKKSYSIYYHLITHNVRITRELNNIMLEQENLNNKGSIDADQQQRLNICMYWFIKNLQFTEVIAPSAAHLPYDPDHLPSFPGKLSLQQVLYLDRMIIELKSMYQDMEKLAQQQDHKL